LVVNNDSGTKNKDQVEYVEEFFLDKSGGSLPIHSFEESPCYPIIGRSIMESMEQQFYYCILHLDPLVWSPDLRFIEQHCKYKEANKHRIQILKLLSVMPIPRPNKDWKTKGMKKDESPSGVRLDLDVLLQ
jgi:hypothetical protein